MLGRDLAFGIGLSYTETDNDNADYDTAIGRFSPSLTFPISENGQLSLRYSAKYSDISETDTEIGRIVAAEAALGPRWDSSVGYTLSYDTRRTGLDPTAGVLLEFGQDIGGLGGDTKFLRTNVRAVAQRLVMSEEVTLRASFEAGAVNYEDGSRVTDRFFLGSSLMRGFESGGIGPRERNGDIDDALGGNMFAVARFEAEFPLGLPDEYGISGAPSMMSALSGIWIRLNADVIYNDASLRHVVGLSVFWDTALGPLRFNFSKALVKEEYDKEQEFELTISTQF